jgi:hypothetical protein
MGIEIKFDSHFFLLFQSIKSIAENPNIWTYLFLDFLTGTFSNYRIINTTFDTFEL